MDILGICLVLCSTSGVAPTDTLHFARNDFTRQLQAPMMADVKLAPEFHIRLHLERATSAPLTDPENALRHRFASSMIDFYPVNGRGLRISAGMRFYNVINMSRDAERMTNGLLYVPRFNSGSGGTRTGFRRRTPAATVGYTWSHNDHLFIGLEGGAVMGRLNSSPPRGFDRDANSDRHHGGINPVANLAFALKF